MAGSHAMERSSKWTHAKEPILLVRSRERQIVLGRLGQNGHGVISMGRPPEHGKLPNCRQFSETHASEASRPRPHVTVTAWIVKSPHGLGGTIVIRHAMADRLTGMFAGFPAFPGFLGLLGLLGWPGFRGFLGFLGFRPTGIVKSIATHLEVALLALRF